MGGAFSSSKKSSKTKTPPKGTISAIDRAVLDLKNSRDRLSRYKTKTTSDCDKLFVKAQSLQSTSKTTTANPTTKSTILNLLKLRKYKLNEIENVNSQLLTIEQMITNIQTKEEEQNVLSALRTGKDALQKLHEENTVEDVLKLMDEVEEQNELENEINGILGGVAGGDSLSVEDMEELEKELESMMKKDEGESVTATTDDVVVKDETKDDKIELPEVPTEKLPVVENQEQPVVEEKPARVAVPS